MPGQVSGPLLFAVCSAVLGMLQFGYNTGVINAPQTFIEAFIKDVKQVEADSASFMFSIIVSMLALAGMFTSISAGFFAEKYGRRRTMLFNAFIGVVGAVCMAFSKNARSYELLLIGRMLMGFNCGLATAVSPTYVSEVAPMRLRGAFGTVNQLAVAFGLVGSQILGIDVILGSENGWPWLFGLAVIPSAIQCMMLPFTPESPRYLLLTRKDEEGARDVLAKLRGTSEIDGEIDDMQAEGAEYRQEVGISFKQYLTSKHLRTPLIIGVVMHLSQQLGGINAVLYYSTNIFKGAGLEEKDARLATIGVGSILFVMAVVSVPLMDRLGRRTLQLWGLGGMTVFSVLMTVAFFTYKDNSTMSVFAVIFTLLYVTFFAVGPSSIPWMIMSELFAQATRSTAVSFGAFVNWFANFIVGITFIPLTALLGNFVFLPYTVLLILFFLFTYFKLPETKNIPIEEVVGLFKK